MNEAELLQQLADRHLTLGSCESVTGGLFGANICQVPGASNVYLGGLISEDHRGTWRRLGRSRLRDGH